MGTHTNFRTTVQMFSDDAVQVSKDMNVIGS